MEQNRRLAQQWLQTAVDELSKGEELLLPTNTKQDAKEKLRLFSKELRVLAKIDLISASELQIATRFKDHRFWLVIKKVAFSPLIAFKKRKSGEVKRILIDDPSERRRRLLLMKADGYTVSEIEEIERNLTEEELELLK
ncbi:MAG: hypothetical protein GPJ50_03875 [Candidatus Heimdallarchaeota archaeon]|nr:hypothetical protein [Candidatus Heimdallarchaeota archaeon]